MAHEGEEAGDGEGFIAVADNLIVDRVLIEEEGEQRDECVDGNHK